jgi:hypothetical protein
MSRPSVNSSGSVPDFRGGGTGAGPPVCVAASGGGLTAGGPGFGGAGGGRGRRRRCRGEVVDGRRLVGRLVAHHGHPEPDQVPRLQRDPPRELLPVHERPVLAPQVRDEGDVRPGGDLDPDVLAGDPGVVDRDVAGGETAEDGILADRDAPADLVAELDDQPSEDLRRRGRGDVGRRGGGGGARGA